MLHRIFSGFGMAMTFFVSIPVGVITTAAGINWLTMLVITSMAFTGPAAVILIFMGRAKASVPAQSVIKPQGPSQTGDATIMDGNLILAGPITLRPMDDDDLRNVKNIVYRGTDRPLIRGVKVGEDWPNHFLVALILVDDSGAQIFLCPKPPRGIFEVQERYSSYSDAKACVESLKAPLSFSDIRHAGFYCVVREESEVDPNTGYPLGLGQNRNVAGV